MAVAIQHNADPNEERLAELAAIANNELAILGASLKRSFEHAVRIGEVLQEAHSLVAEGEWLAWVAANFDGSRASVNVYRRIYLFRDKMPADVFTIQDAREFCEAAGLELPRARVDIDEARRLRHKGLTYREIAAELGVSASAVFLTLNQKTANASRKRRRRLLTDARKALEQKKATAAAKRIGGNVHEASSRYRKLAEMLQVLLDTAPNDEARKEIKLAFASLYRCGDAINRAIALWE